MKVILIEDVKTLGKKGRYSQCQRWLCAQFYFAEEAWY